MNDVITARPKDLDAKLHLWSKTMNRLGRILPEEEQREE